MKQRIFASVTGTFAAMARGVTAPWPLVASALLGAWLMFTRLAFASEPPIADSDHLAGALAGFVLVALSLPRGRLGAEHYGRWDRLIV